MRFQRLSTLALALLLALATAARAQPPSWAPLGPFGGAVFSITADPATPGVLYAGTASGIHKTTDAGAHWSLILGGRGGKVTVDPVHPSILYLTGAFPGPAVHKSVDGGAHWFTASDGLPDELPVLAVDPVRPRRLYLGSFAGFWRSLDGGASWQPAGSGLPEGVDILALAAAPRSSGKLLAATQRGVYRSNDGGTSWVRVGRSLPAAQSTAVAFSPSDPRIVFASLARSGNTGAEGLYRSADGGATWKRVLKVGRFAAIEISISPSSPGLMYVRFGDGALFCSTDGGNRWFRIPSASPSTAVAVDPFSAAVYASRVDGSVPGGVWRSGDLGKTWEARSRGIDALEARSLAIDPVDADRLWTSAGDAFTLLRSTDRGASWARVPIPPGEDAVLRLAAGPSHRIFALAWQFPATEFEPSIYSLWRTADGGTSWTRLPVPSDDVYQFRSAASFVYAVETSPAGVLSPVQRFLRSTDGGDPWESRPQTTLSCGLGDLQVAPSNAMVVYLGGCKGEHVAAVLRSGDGGVTFTDASAGLPGTYVPALAVDPRDPGTLWAGTGNRFLEEPGDGVWKSTDGGAHWARAGSRLAGLTVTALVAVDVPGRVYAVVGDSHVFRSGDGGATWEDWNAGLRVTGVSGLVADPEDPRRIYAVTTNGVWTLTETD